MDYQEMLKTLEELKKVVDEMLKREASRIHIYPTDVCPKCGQKMEEQERFESAIRYQCVNSQCECFHEAVIRYLADSPTLASVYPALVSHTEPRLKLTDFHSE